MPRSSSRKSTTQTVKTSYHTFHPIRHLNGEKPIISIVSSQSARKTLDLSAETLAENVADLKRTMQNSVSQSKQPPLENGGQMPAENTDGVIVTREDALNPVDRVRELESQISRLSAENSRLSSTVTAQSRSLADMRLQLQSKQPTDVLD